jgi:hypothetical protein
MISGFARSLQTAGASALPSVSTLQPAMAPEAVTAWQINSPNAVGLTVDKTVGLDANVCAATDSIEVEPGTRVAYCYKVTNTGDDTLVFHDLMDDQLGTLLSNFPFILAPSASAFLTQTTIINDSVTNTATWTARTERGMETSDSDTATVTVVQPSLSVEKTVGTNANVCAVTDSIEVEPGTRVTYCYMVLNTGSLPLVSHDLVDDQLGTLLSDFPYILAPNASAFLTQTAIINSSVTNTATWTARTAASNQASDSDTATVTANYRRLLPLILK